MALKPRDLYTVSFPLGPDIAGDALDKDRLRLLFDDQNKLVSQLNHERSLIIGRKGSGKTTLLVSVQLSDPKAKFFYLPSADLFARIMREINVLSEGVVFVEQVSRLWDFVFWGIIFNEVAVDYNEADLVAYCQALGVKSDQSPYELIETMLSKIKSFPPPDWPIPEKIAYKKIGSISFLQAKQIAVDRLTRENVRIYLLMDALEDFKLDIPTSAAAVAGLLRCLGEFNERRAGPVLLRCCMPAERYFDYTRLSTNPLKDFRNGLLLHWRAGELIQLSAVRYARFLEEYFPTFFRDHISSLDLRKRDHLKRFWNLIFPNPVTSRLGSEETPMGYILRHTQLLPRHFIRYLNAIISRSLKEDKAAYGISSNRIRGGVFDTEKEIMEQILEAYTTPTTQEPRKACEATLKELKTTFTWSDFDSIAAKVTKMGIPGVSDRTELMSLLTEVGAVGRVVGDTEKYFTGLFEYMVPHKLVTSDRDKFCIHPVFTEACNVNVDYKGVKAIYTYWSGITEDDVQDWM